MGYFQFIVALLFSSLASLFIFFRIFESYFYSKDDAMGISTRIKESRLFVIPLVSVSAGIILLGITFNYWFQFIQNIIPMGLR